MSKFSFATSPEGFDNHISNSIRGYDVLNENIVSISKYFVEPQTNVFDLGSEEHTSELQSRLHIVCRLLLEKKNTTQIYPAM